MKQYRQGDVLLIEVESIPADAVIDLLQDNKAMLAYGEVTGHAHVIKAPSKTMNYVSDPQGRRFPRDNSKGRRGQDCPRKAKHQCKFPLREQPSRWTAVSSLLLMA